MSCIIKKQIFYIIFLLCSGMSLMLHSSSPYEGKLPPLQDPNLLQAANLLSSQDFPVCMDPLQATNRPRNPNLQNFQLPVEYQKGEKQIQELQKGFNKIKNADKPLYNFKHHLTFAAMMTVAAGAVTGVLATVEGNKFIGTGLAAHYATGYGIHAFQTLVGAGALLICYNKLHKLVYGDINQRIEDLQFKQTRLEKSVQDSLEIGSICYGQLKKLVEDITETQGVVDDLHENQVRTQQTIARAHKLIEEINGSLQQLLNFSPGGKLKLTDAFSTTHSLGGEVDARYSPTELNDHGNTENPAAGAEKPTASKFAGPYISGLIACLTRSRSR